MVFTKISSAFQLQWNVLCGAFNAEGHERRAQKRQEKLCAKQQRKAARRAGREARRAQRKQRRTLLSSSVIGEPTDDKERSTTSGRPNGKQSEVLPAKVDVIWAASLEFRNVADADEGAGVFGCEPSVRRKDAPQSLQKPRLNSINKKPVMADVTVLTASTAMEALPHLTMEFAVDVETPLEQNQRQFYDSLGGYSTVDEEDDELLPAVLASSQQACDNKVSFKLTTVNSKKAVNSRQELEQNLCKTSDQENAIGGSYLLSLTAFTSTASKPGPRSLLDSSELVKTKPEDEEIYSPDSAAYDGYSTHVKQLSQDLCSSKIKLSCLDALPAADLLVQCRGETSIDDFVAKVDPPTSSCCFNCHNLKVVNKTEEEIVVENYIETDLNEEELLEMSSIPEELETEKPSRRHDLSNEDVLLTAQAEYPMDKLFDEEPLKNKLHKLPEALNVVKEVKVELKKGVKKDETVYQDVIAQPEEPLLPVHKDMLDQTASLNGYSNESIVQSQTSQPEIYSPGTADEYACSIYENLRAREHRYHVTEDIFVKQQSVRPRMRAVLVDWLVEVHQRFELETQTLYLTVNYIDRYLAQASVSPQRFQLVGVTALLIASKFEEIYPCDMNDLLYICERSYSTTDLVDCERDLLNVFKFSLAVPSVSSFLGYYLEYFEEDKIIGQLANYFAECSLLDFTFGATYEPSIVACACLLAAFCYVENQTPRLVWNSCLEGLTGYGVEAIIPCTQDLSSILIQPIEFTAVAMKYSRNELGEVAHLLLDDLEMLLC